MTGGQWRVLAILLAILGIEIVSSTTTRDAGKALLKGDFGSIVNLKGMGAAALGFAIGAIALLAIAAWQDGVATALAVLFLVLVLINRGDTIGPVLEQGTAALQGLTGQGKSSK